MSTATRLVAALLAAALAGAPVAAHAHAHLSSSAPEQNATVQSPTRVTLVFTQALEKRFAKIELQDASGQTVAGIALQDEADPATLSVRLPAELPGGVYTVVWHVTSVDTHRTEGRFTFTIAH